MSIELKQRSDVIEEDKWDIEDLYPSALDWKTDFEKTASFSTVIAEFTGKLADSPESLMPWRRFSLRIDCLLICMYMPA